MTGEREGLLPGREREIESPYGTTRERVSLYCQGERESLYHRGEKGSLPPGRERISTTGDRESVHTTRECMRKSLCYRREKVPLLPGGRSPSHWGVPATVRLY